MAGIHTVIQQGRPGHWQDAPGLWYLIVQDADGVELMRSIGFERRVTAESFATELAMGVLPKPPADVAGFPRI